MPKLLLIVFLFVFTPSFAFEVYSPSSSPRPAPTPSAMPTPAPAAPATPIPAGPALQQNPSISPQGTTSQPVAGQPAFQTEPPSSTTETPAANTSPIPPLEKVVDAPININIELSDQQKVAIANSIPKLNICAPGNYILEMNLKNVDTEETTSIIATYNITGWKEEKCNLQITFGLSNSPIAANKKNCQLSKTSLTSYVTQLSDFIKTEAPIHVKNLGTMENLINKECQDIPQ